jgi:hypothetical protein
MPEQQLSFVFSLHPISVPGTQALLVLHLLLLVAWLGVDVGVFYSSFVLRREGLTTETRREIRRIMVALDLGPRVSLILMIPVALGLAYLTGLGLRTGSSALGPVVLWLIAGGAVLWAAGTIWAFRRSPSNKPRWFGRLDVTLRVLASAGFISLGLASLGGSGPLGPRWLAWKALLFGVIIALGLGIRLAAARYRPALEELLTQGESPERLAAVNRSIRGVYPLVLAVWGILILITVIAVTKP